MSPYFKQMHALWDQVALASTETERDEAETLYFAMYKIMPKKQRLEFVFTLYDYLQHKRKEKT